MTGAADDLRNIDQEIASLGDSKAIAEMEGNPTDEHLAQLAELNLERVAWDGYRLSLAIEYQTADERLIALARYTHALEIVAEGLQPGLLADPPQILPAYPIETDSAQFPGVEPSSANPTEDLEAPIKLTWEQKTEYRADLSRLADEFGCHGHEILFAALFDWIPNHAKLSSIGRIIVNANKAGILDLHGLNTRTAQTQWSEVSSNTSKLMTEWLQYSGKPGGSHSSVYRRRKTPLAWDMITIAPQEMIRTFVRSLMQTK